MEVVVGGEDGAHRVRAEELLEDAGVVGVEVALKPGEQRAVHEDEDVGRLALASRSARNHSSCSPVTRPSSQYS